MADSNRPRPRPRPRPKVQATPSIEDVTPSLATSKAASSSPVKKPVAVDTDEMFMRNRGRSIKDWKFLDNQTKEVKVVHVDTDSEDDATPKPRKGGKRKANEQPWQANSVLERYEDIISILQDPDSNCPTYDSLLSVEVEDSDDEIEIVGTSTSPRKPNAPARKRQKTRSRSITPPPELPRHQLQHARALVQQTLAHAPRPASPKILDDDDDSDDAMFSNPELAKLVNSAARRAQSHASSPALEGVDTVQLSVKWQSHPLNPNGEKETWVFKMNRDDNFRDLFEAVAEEASILSENLIMSYNNKRIYASVTPKALKLWGEANLVGCDNITYEYLRSHPAAASNSLSTFDAGTPAPEGASDEEAPASSQEAPDAGSGSDDNDDDETFKLVLRSSLSAKDITLTVRPTTKCGAIVKAYLNKAGVADQYPGVFADDGAKAALKKGKKAGPEKDPRLCVDGDKMENTAPISEADLEDGDLVEVVGL
ncbi:hypothetical protein H0H81_002254 [Sphagnurus paluster]|uniref:Rad60/SUMO-like domain-containing protein n=1 Tax=Sphagnurus paluster TaxID=117069 RepID=A0A9P7GU09_9AGAR|nr:hypothetical protein H0H81_002254 [Sphagnurus paluster]